MPFDVIYLACPYTDPDPKIREARFDAANKAAAALISKGRIVYSPISMTHPIDVVLNTGTGGTLGSDFWVAFDEAFMQVCSEIVVLTINGWQSSRGVRREIDYFRQRSKPIFMMDEKYRPKLAQDMEIEMLIQEALIL